jgi:hypothetical protein
MSNEVSPLQTVQENIKARIQSEFVNLIPDEMWDRMVTSQVDEFTKDKPESYGRGGTVPSPLKAMIRTAIEEQAKAGVKQALDRVASGVWSSHGETVVVEAMKKLIDEHFDMILKSVQSGMVEFVSAMVMNRMRDSINQSVNHGIRF